MPENKEWNHDRLVSASAMIHNVQTDILMVASRGVVSTNVRTRMAEFLRNAAEEIENMRVK